LIYGKVSENPLQRNGLAAISTILKLLGIILYKGEYCVALSFQSDVVQKATRTIEIERYM
jgi:hypothetical protein